MWDWLNESVWIFPRYTLFLMVLLVVLIYVFMRIRKNQV